MQIYYPEKSRKFVRTTVDNFGDLVLIILEEKDLPQVPSPQRCEDIIREYLQTHDTLGLTEAIKLLQADPYLEYVPKTALHHNYYRAMKIISGQKGPSKKERMRAKFAEARKLILQHWNTHHKLDAALIIQQMMESPTLSWSKSTAAIRYYEVMNQLVLERLIEKKKK